MADYKTPGVYVEEISTLPPSVGQVPTAVPAFIGYTGRALKHGKNLKNVPVHITSLLEYQEVFGGACHPGKIEVKLDDNNHVESVGFEKRFFLYDNVRMFFANGGGECYIVSVGSYEDELNADAIAEGIAACKKEDHPTMLLIPDAVLLEKSADCYSLQQQLLMQCNELQDRVAILDIYDGYIDRSDKDVVLDFRNGIGINFLKYGAAYYPWLQTTLSTSFGFEDIVLKGSDDSELELSTIVSDPSAINRLKEVIKDLEAIKGFVKDPMGDETSLKDKFFKVEEDKLNKKDELVHYLTVLKDLVTKIFELRDGGTIQNNVLANELNVKTNPSSNLANVIKGVTAVDLGAGTGIINPEADFAEYELATVKPSPALEGIEDEGTLVLKGKAILKKSFEDLVDILVSIKTDAEKIKDHDDKVVYDTNVMYKSIVNEVQKEASKLPPGGAMAGIYAMVDNNRGVWKAPANVSMNSVVKPWVKIDNQQQEDLNVDVNAGKSINAIRGFKGKGTLVWGARTLAGNDNEWRYVSVRRFFNMVEKSVKLSTNWAVFEPNDANTWIRVKAMIENYLTNLWKAGALAGSTPDQSFFVHIGLGSTMSPVDILEGRMNVEIGMAVVRPAEFIVLKFSHKLQES
ncbi:MAG: phage tail protein [Marinilabiliales bacterium]|nr:MAG: phage tail protein [Marinilabiliales bacterium]